MEISEWGRGLAHVARLATGEGADHPFDSAPPNLPSTCPRGLPVVTTAAMAVDKFLVGNFAQGATLYDRMSARVEISTEASDNFRRNKVTVLAEERIALAVKNTLASTKGAFSDAIVDLTS